MALWSLQINLDLEVDDAIIYMLQTAHSYLDGIWNTWICTAGIQFLDFSNAMNRIQPVLLGTCYTSTPQIINIAQALPPIEVFFAALECLNGE